MARTRKLSELRADAYKRSDNESAADRFPSAEVDRYVNEGNAELYDLLIEARGRSYYRKKPSMSIATLASTTSYALPPDFYRLIAVRIDDTFGEALYAFRSEDEPWLRAPGYSAMWPTHYELQGSDIVLLPVHDAGHTVIVDYVPVYTDLVGDDDTFDGINGWEEYSVSFAARLMALKDEEYDLVKALESDMGRMRERIQRLAPTRDQFRAERVKDVRGPRIFGRGRW